MGCTKSKPENIKITSVLLSNKMRGENVTNQRGTFNVSGEGSILANTPILQERSQFEVKIIKKGAFCLGLAGKGINFGNALFCQPNVWCLNVDDHIISIGEDKIELELPIDYNIGDIFGCSYDGETVQFYHNGKVINYIVPLTITRLKSPFYPAVSVSSQAEIECIFEMEDFGYSLEEKGFRGVMSERSIV